ncbi:MAG: hypothetical protein AAGA72_10870 [Pseudomonadota bacterium]
MLKPMLIAFASLCLSLACATAQERSPEPEAVPAWLEKDFADFVSEFAGHWDSDRHVFFAEQAGLEPAGIAPRQHIQIELLEKPTDTLTAVFKATRTVDGNDPVELIHTLVADAASNKILQTMALPQADPFDCSILWQREAAQFLGTADGAGCAQVFPRPGEGGPLEVTLAKSADEFWVTARRGENVSEARLRRARPFECWAAVLRGATHGDSGEGMRDWDFRRGVTLHDQGGEAELITDEEPPRRIRLRLRNVDWPYGTNRPSLTLYVLEGDNDRAVSYAWNEGDADRIGLNLRWLQASCTHAPERDDQ